MGVEQMEKLHTGWLEFRDQIIAANGGQAPMCAKLEMNLSSFRTNADIDKVYRRQVMLVRDMVNPMKAHSILASFAVRHGLVFVHPYMLLMKMGMLPGNEALKKRIRNEL